MSFETLYYFIIREKHNGFGWWQTWVKVFDGGNMSTTRVGESERRDNRFWTVFVATDDKPFLTHFSCTRTTWKIGVSRDVMDRALSREGWPINLASIPFPHSVSAKNVSAGNKTRDKNVGSCFGWSVDKHKPHFTQFIENNMTSMNLNILTVDDGKLLARLLPPPRIRGEKRERDSCLKSTSRRLKGFEKTGSGHELT